MVYVLGPCYLDRFVSLTGVLTRYAEDGKRLCDAYVVAVAGGHFCSYSFESILTSYTCNSGGSGSGKVALATSHLFWMF
jgi:hypothetical protein